ncbi:MAG: sigma 54-interacting transcriptional regulator [Candidatus Krumholzibacteria bacterium]
MSNARDDRDRLQHNRKKRSTESIYAPSEEVGLMHLATENYSTAIEYFQEALQSPDLNDTPDRYRILLHIGDCYRSKGNYKQAQKFLDRARVLLDDPAPAEALGKIELREAESLLARGSYNDALKLGFSAYRRLKHSTEHREVGDIQKLLANCYHRIGLASEAEDFFMDALSTYRRIEDRLGIAIVYNNLGLLHKNACRWNRALASLSKSLDLAKSLGHTQHLIRVQLNLGVVYAKLRRFSEALTCFATAGNMAERFGDQAKLAKAVLMQGRTHIACGDFCKAEKNILRGQAMANELGYEREAALADEYLGELMLALGKPEEALVNLNNGLRRARRIAPEGDVTAEILRRVADAHLLQGNVDKALSFVDEGLEIANACGEFYELGYFYRTRGLCQRRRGEFEVAAVSLKTSVDMFEQYGIEFEKFSSQRRLGRFHLRSRDQETLIRAKQLLTESIVGFGKIEEFSEQMMSQVLLAVVEERLGNLDDALLAIYEAGRLAEEERNAKFQKLLAAMRARVESKMTRDTRRVLDQIPMFGNAQSGLRSRDKLVAGLSSSLKLILEKANAQNGFVAIPKGRSKGFEVVCRENLRAREAKAILSWYLSEAGTAPDQGLMIRDADDTGLNGDGEQLDIQLGKLLFQELGFENDALGVVFMNQEPGPHRVPIGQEVLHFVGAYSRLISLSVYELARNERRREPKARPSASGFDSIVTNNIEMIKLLNLAERVAHSNATVLLQGETGTGKGLIAYAVHLLSERRDKPFVHINCAAMPESLLESELFGHAKGSFTGATVDKSGLLNQADGGTIFLDEIGKTTLAMQGKLLQFLDTSKIRKVGSNEMRPVDVRVICASKADLLSLCHEGRFLEDFFYRINDFPLTVPPLRKRREDIELLFFHYLRKYSCEMGKDITDITDEALDMLRDFHWAGNVRELDKVVKRAVILADDGETLDVRHLPSEIVSPAAKRGARKNVTLRDQIDRLEKTEIQAALERSGWNKSQAATALGISYPNILSKIKRFNLRCY